ncbi:MAG TPA: SMI1/KNR4 family protein [Pyrinomonadaceae bacterium]|jgi:hypothetical protein|nr:SMI1/KNR4 family protein [Pyrinomonadaceae bacterium]
MENWRALFATLEVNGEAKSLCGDEELRRFEEKARITLPDDFKEYCRVFGSGAHGREFFIYCPCPSGAGGDLLSFGLDRLEAYRGAVSYEINHFLEGHPAADYDKVRWLEKILSNAFPFATNGFAEIFVWHLDSYSETDRSHDIYRIGIDELDEARLVGRDFYKFVAEFIYEQKIDGVPLKDNRYPEIRRTFDPIERFITGGI